jgi:hypothetical protein
VGRIALRVSAVLLAATTLLLIACAPTAQLQPSPPGKYEQGSAIVLANGSRLTVPDGWEASLQTTGSAIERPPERTGIIGGVMTVPAVPHWGSLIFSVYRPGAGLKSQRSLLDKLYQRGPTAMTPKVSRTTFRYDGASVTALLTQYGRREPEAYYEVDLLVDRARAEPVSIAAALGEIPPALGGTASDDLPRRLLDYLNFKVR